MPTEMVHGDVYFRVLFSSCFYVFGSSLEFFLCDSPMRWSSSIALLPGSTLKKSGAHILPCLLLAVHGTDKLLKLATAAPVSIVDGFTR